MGVPLAHGADPGFAVDADRLERVFWVNFARGRDELAAGRIGAEYPGLPGRAELLNCFEENLLLVFWEDILDDGAGNRLGAASRRHL